MFGRQNNNPQPSQKPSRIKNFFNIVLTIIITVLIVFAGLFVWQNFFDGPEVIPEDQGDQFTVTVDKTAIIQEVQSLERLETVRQVIQRDIQVTVDLGDLEVFGVSILENKRTQDFTITGYVTAGIDLGAVEAEDVELSAEEKEVLIRLPAPEVFDANIIEDQTRIIREDITVLYNLETLDGERRRELNEQLFQLVVKESRKALVQAACDDEILATAEENADESMQKLFGTILSENFIVETAVATSCGLEGVT